MEACRPRLGLKQLNGAGMLAAKDQLRLFRRDNCFQVERDGHLMAMMLIPTSSTAIAYWTIDPPSWQ